MAPVVRFVVAGVDTQAAPPSLGRPYTVVYDGHCKVCTRLAKALMSWDGQRAMEVVPSQAPGVQARFPWIPARAYTESLQVVGPGGQTWQGAAAIEQILNVLPKGALVAWVFRIPFARATADRFYRWFARNRYRLGCGEHCQYRPPSSAFDP
jgi:predicted DCC family thiol-disulfide oxidoreductase YuxK